MADLAKLVVSLEANTARYSRELNKANKKISRFERRQKKSLRNIARGFKALVAAAAGLQFTRLINQSIQFQDRIAKINDRLGISAEAFSELNFAAEQAGIGTRAFELGLQRLSRRVSEAAIDTGEAIGAIKELGLSAAELTKLPLEDQLAKIADALQNVTGDADKVRLAFKLFDAEGVTFLQFLKDGSAGMADMRANAQRLGATVTQDMADRAEEAAESMGALKAALSGVNNTITALLAPSIAALAEGLNDLLITDKSEDLEAAIDRRSQLINQLAEARPGTELFEKLQLELNGTQFMIELLTTRIAKEEAAAEALNEQRDLLQEIIVLEKKRSPVLFEEVFVKFRKVDETIFDGIEELTIQTELDRILRPDQKFDVELVERAFSALNDEVEETNELAQDLGFTFESAFENAIIEGGKLRDVLKGLIDDILRIAIRSSITGPLGNFFGNIFGGIFGGGRADGGPVSPGKSFLVGERGPEMFVPGVAGNIVPNGGAAPVFNLITKVEAGVDPGRLVPILDQNNKRLKGEIVDELQRGKYQ